MPFHYLQAGGGLYRAPAGAASASSVTLLNHLSLEARRPNFAILLRRVCISNSPSFNIMMVPGDAVRSEEDRMVPMSPIAPNRAVGLLEGTPVVLGPNDTTVNRPGLTGTYKVRVSHAVKDLDTGAILAESPLSPASEVETLAGEALRVKGIPISNEPGVNCRRVYRTQAGASNVYYSWRDIDNNEETALTGDASDISIALAPAPLDDETGNPPGSFGSDTRLQLLTAWKGRLFGVAGGTPLAENDTLLWSEVRRPDRWPTFNNLPIAGGGEQGITGLIARRLTLGIGTQESFSVIASPGAAPKEIASVGPVSHESCVSHDDTAWFIAKDGIYQWGADNRVMNVSRDRVHPWFTENDTFNRAAFDKIEGTYHEGRQSVIWLMPSARQNNLDRWIEYYPQTGIILGPHKVQENMEDPGFTFTSLGVYNTEVGLDEVAFAATDGRVYREDALHYDGQVLGQPIENPDPHRNNLFTGTVGTAGSLTYTFDGGNTLATPISGSGQITITFDEGRHSSPIFDWGDMADSETVKVGEHNVTIGEDASNNITLTLQEDLFPLRVRVDSVDLNQPVSDRVTLPQGVEVKVEVQTQTMGEPDFDKYYGELSLFMNADAGNRIQIKTDLDDGNDVRYHGFYTGPDGNVVDEIAGAIKTRFRLNRVGTGDKLSIELSEDSTADVDWFGYQVWPLGIVGHRHTT